MTDCNGNCEDCEYEEEVVSLQAMKIVGPNYMAGIGLQNKKDKIGQMVACSACGSEGAVEFHAGPLSIPIACSICDGTGFVFAIPANVWRELMAKNIVAQMIQAFGLQPIPWGTKPCKVCGQVGMVYIEHKEVLTPCPRCGGSGAEPEMKPGEKK